MLATLLMSSVVKHNGRVSAMASVKAPNACNGFSCCFGWTIAGSIAFRRGKRFKAQQQAFPRSLKMSRSDRREFLWAHRQVSNVDDAGESLTMHNLYQQWSILDDYYLYQHRKEPIHRLASVLGRGLRGVQTRLNKLTDVNSQAYERLFASGTQRKLMSAFKGDDDDSGPFLLEDRKEDDGDVTSSVSTSCEKLTPAKDVLRRIQWDALLTPSDFFVNYYDRMADAILSVPFTVPNTSVKGKEELFVLAIPEHRIASIQYKERIVWNKYTRLDLICGSGRRVSNGITIRDVIDTYDEWKILNDEMRELNKNRQREVVAKIKGVLGVERFQLLKDTSDQLRRLAQTRGKSSGNESDNVEDDIKSYVKKSYQLFELARKDLPDGQSTNQLESLELFSELASTLPDADLRESILLEISILAGRFTKQSPASENEPAPLVQLREEDITEKFIRGSGAGGQKINKTSNRVILVHEPTQLQVECQETRSLQQNRKIARKRLLEKVDIHVNGSNSRFAIKASKKAEKKIKAKVRSKTRLRKRLEQRLEGRRQDDDDDSDDGGDSGDNAR